MDSTHLSKKFGQHRERSILYSTVCVHWSGSWHSRCVHIAVGRTQSGIEQEYWHERWPWSHLLIIMVYLSEENTSSLKLSQRKHIPACRSVFSKYSAHSTRVSWRGANRDGLLEAYLILVGRGGRGKHGHYKHQLTLAGPWTVFGVSRPSVRNKLTLAGLWTFFGYPIW